MLCKGGKLLSKRGNFLLRRSLVSSQPVSLSSGRKETLQQHDNSELFIFMADVLFSFRFFFSSLPAGPVRVRKDVNDDDDDEEEEGDSGCCGPASGLSQLRSSSIKRGSYP